MTGSVPTPENQALAGLAGEIRSQSVRLASLDARLAPIADMEARLRDVLKALEIIHDDDPGTRRRLRRLRESPEYQLAYTERDPLVTIVIPTWNRVETLIRRSIPSALAQSHPNVEVVVIGDASPREVGDAVAGLEDERVRFHNLTIRGPYDDDPVRAWLAAGTPPMNAGLALARGRWIALLGDDDVLLPDHVEKMLGGARERQLEFLYGKISMEPRDGTGEPTLLNEFPPVRGEIALQGAFFHSGLSFIEFELGWPLFGKPNDWGMVRRLMRVGARIGMIDEVLMRYYPSGGYERAAESPHRSTLSDEQPRIQLEEVAAQLGSRLSDAEQQVRELQAQVRQAASDRSDLRGQLERATAEREALTAELRDRLKRAMAERDDLHKRLSDLLGTRAMRAVRSWWQIRECLHGLWTRPD